MPEQALDARYGIGVVKINLLNFPHACMYVYTCIQEREVRIVDDATVTLCTYGVHNPWSNPC